MKYCILILLICGSCGGKLSDEQRKKLHDGMATQDIRKVSDADLQAAAMELGKSIMNDVISTDKNLNKKSKIDSIARQRNVLIYSLVPDDSTLQRIEKELVEAYITGADPGNSGENLQKAGSDSLLYTKPIFRDRPDGSQQFSHAIGIKMDRKTVVLSMPSI